MLQDAKSTGVVVDAVVGAGGNQLQVNGVTPFVVESTNEVRGSGFSPGEQ